MAHTAKYNRRHICQVYQRYDYDGTVELVLPAIIRDQEAFPF